MTAEERQEKLTLYLENIRAQSRLRAQIMKKEEELANELASIESLKERKKSLKERLAALTGMA